MLGPMGDSQSKKNKARKALLEIESRLGPAYSHSARLMWVLVFALSVYCAGPFSTFFYFL